MSVDRFGMPEGCKKPRIASRKRHCFLQLADAGVQVALDHVRDAEFKMRSAQLRTALQSLVELRNSLLVLAGFAAGYGNVEERLNRDRIQLPCTLCLRHGLRRTTPCRKEYRQHPMTVGMIGVQLQGPAEFGFSGLPIPIKPIENQPQNQVCFGNRLVQ